MSRRIWISWSFQRRSQELAKAFSAAYFSIGDEYSGRLRRYIFCIPRTMKIIMNEKPSVLFVQNPSLVLAVMAVALKAFFRYTLVIDLHTPYIKLNRILNSIFWAAQKFCASRADLTLVTNINMKHLFSGDHIHILPDKLPHFENPATERLAGTHAIAFVCTFSEDEPYGEVGKAALLIDPAVHIYVTGRYEKANWPPEAIPPNLHLTGFLPEKAYAALLNSADAVMVLTTQSDCLVCGAYESVALNKPMILSDRNALRNYFSRGAVYVDDTAESIAAGITAMLTKIEEMKGEVLSLRETLEHEWKETFDTVASRLDSLTTRAR